MCNFLHSESITALGSFGSFLAGVGTFFGLPLLVWNIGQQLKDSKERERSFHLERSERMFQLVLQLCEKQLDSFEIDGHSSHVPKIRGRVALKQLLMSRTSPDSAGQLTRRSDSLVGAITLLTSATRAIDGDSSEFQAILRGAYGDIVKLLLDTERDQSPLQIDYSKLKAVSDFISKDFKRI